MLLIVIQITFDYVLKNLQYTIASIYYLKYSDDKEAYKKAMESIFSDETLLVLRIESYYNQCLPLFIACFVCLIVRYFAGTKDFGDDDESDNTSQNTYDRKSINEMRVQGSVYDNNHLSIKKKKTKKMKKSNT